jgi:hypothetical protein
MSQKYVLATGVLSVLFCLTVAHAHHSFAVYDFSQQIEFVGTVDTLNFKNPHIAMTLSVVDAEGHTEIVNFIEGAPANMLARKGLTPDMIAPGKEITAIGSPLIEDPSKYFLRRVRLPDGREFE